MFACKLNKDWDHHAIVAKSHAKIEITTESVRYRVIAYETAHADYNNYILHALTKPCIEPALYGESEHFTYSIVYICINSIN